VNIIANLELKKDKTVLPAANYKKLFVFLMLLLRLQMLRQVRANHMLAHPHLLIKQDFMPLQLR